MTEALNWQDVADADAFWDRSAENSQPITSVLDIDDFPMVEIDPVECAGRDMQAWKDDPKNSPRPADIYRKWAKRLREVSTPEAKDLLREIQLECTMPFNELETPHWIDSYTGEVIKEDDDIAENGPIELPEWQHFLVTRLRTEYKDDDTALQAMRASSAWVGVEEEYEILEDRGYEPATFTQSLFTTDELQFMRIEIAPLAEALRKQISTAVERGGTQEVIQARVRNSREAENYCIMVQNMLDRGEETQDVYMLMRPFTHAYGFIEELDWSALKTNINGFPTLFEWAVEFEDMINYTEEGSPLAHTTTSEQEVRDIAEQFLQELVDVVPVEGDRTPLNTKVNPIMRSRYYVEGFLRAQINGAENPSLEAWSHWRRKTSSAGSIAYEETFKKTTDRKQAMAAFWKAALKAGDVKGQPKRIAAVKPSGLVLADKRKITWSTACKIAQAEGFEKQDRLLEILKSKQWGLGLMRVLEAQTE